MSTQPHGVAGSDTVYDQFADQLGVLAGCEWSPEPYVEVTEEEKAAIKLLNTKASRRDYPARLEEVVRAWEAALFFRGYQFLVPQRGGGWQIPGESTGYGPSMQLDLALLPTNVYSAYAQIIISTLTRAVPSVRFTPQTADDDRGITAAESAKKFVKVIERNNPLIKIQTDACRYLYNDSRFCYYSRYVRDGQRFGWEEEDEPELVPETEPPEASAAPAEQNAAPPIAGEETQNVQEQDAEEGAPPEPKKRRTPRGQEVRSAHGKLEIKLSPMSANDLCDVDSLQYETEISVARAKGRFPQVADDIKATSTGVTEGEIAKLARQNVKLGMQSTYVTSDSIAEDVTIQMSWHRASEITKIENEAVRNSLLDKFPDGVMCVYAGEVFCYARNQGIDDCWALGQAFSGDGQNRNALGTSEIPVQKRINNWLDLANDFFIRGVPKKWMHNKAFDVEGIKQQTNVPGDIGAYKPQPNMTAAELIFVEPQIVIPEALFQFVQNYMGELSQLLTGGYPALAGMEESGNPTAKGKQVQRDQALGRLAQTWHSIQDAEAVSMRQLVRWGAKCRDGSINEQIPGGEVIRLEVNDLKGNILCYAEADTSFPETHADKEAKLDEVMELAQKNEEMQVVLYNPANLTVIQEIKGLTDLYIPQVAAYEKQLGEFELLLAGAPLDNPQIAQATETADGMIAKGVDPAQFEQAHIEAQQLPPKVSSVPVRPWNDHDSEAFACLKWLNSPEGRKAAKNNPEGHANVELHMAEHEAEKAKQQAAPQHKPPSASINLKDLPPAGQVQLAAQDGIQLNEADLVVKQQQDRADKAAALAAKQKPPTDKVQ